MSEKRILALDLLIEDLHTVHPDIRTRSKEFECEDELNELQFEIIQFLSKKRSIME